MSKSEKFVKVTKKHPKEQQSSSSEPSSQNSSSGSSSSNSSQESSLAKPKDSFSSKKDIGYKPNPNSKPIKKEAKSKPPVLRKRSKESSKNSDYEKSQEKFFNRISLNQNLAKPSKEFEQVIKGMKVSQKENSEQHSRDKSAISSKKGLEYAKGSQQPQNQLQSPKSRVVQNGGEDYLKNLKQIQVPNERSERIIDQIKEKPSGFTLSNDNDQKKEIESIARPKKVPLLTNKRRSSHKSNIQQSPQYNYQNSPIKNPYELMKQKLQKKTEVTPEEQSKASAVKAEQKKTAQEKYIKTQQLASLESPVSKPSKTTQVQKYKKDKTLLKKRFHNETRIQSQINPPRSQNFNQCIQSTPSQQQNKKRMASEAVNLIDLKKRAAKKVAGQKGPTNKDLVYLVSMALDLDNKTNSGQRAKRAIKEPLRLRPNQIHKRLKDLEARIDYITLDQVKFCMENLKDLNKIELQQAGRYQLVDKSKK